MRFRTRLSLLFGGLLIISLAVVLLVIGRITRATVIDDIERSLTTTLYTVEKLHQQRVEDLQQNVRLVAGDYGFKAAYSTEDVLTIQTALENHKDRLANADLMFLCDLDNIVLSNTYATALNGEPFLREELLDLAYEEDSGEVSAFAVIDDAVYQLVVTPLLAPDIEAWIISGFRTDHQTASQLSAVTDSEITFFRDSGQNAQLVASTLSDTEQDALIGFIQQSEGTGELQHYASSEAAHIGYFLSLNETAEPRINVFVQRSLDAALAPYRKLSQVILLIFIVSIAGFAIVIVRIARNVTGPISDLSSAAEAIGRGEYETEVPATRNDELGLLVKTFNDMVRGLAEKEVVRDLLGKVVSPEIATKLLAENVELGGEERQVTVLFCDIKGFTRLTESQPPGVVLEALNQFFSGVSRIIEAHGGVVDKYIGDAVMAIFGAPHEDPRHALNAVRCGIEMCDSAETLTASLKSQDGQACEFGVGIHSGAVVAGNIGSTSRFNYTVIGDAVNVASRVEGYGARKVQARLIVTEDVVELCPNVVFTSLGEFELRGRQKPVKIYTSNDTGA